MKIAWVTDSSANLTDDFLKEHPDVHVVPIQIFIGDEVYRDGIDLTLEELYEKLRTTTATPKTSQPATGDFINAYEKIKNTYDTVIAIHISEALSGTLATSKLAAEITGISVNLIDSKLLSEPLAELIRYGISLQNEGKTVGEIVEAINQKVEQNKTYVTVGNLAALHRSGRMTSTQYLLGSMLQIKPIIELTEGKLEVKQKVRSEKKATEKMVSIIDEAIAESSLSKLFILHVNAVEKAKEWKQAILEKHPELAITISDLSSAIGVHTGEGTIAVSWFNE